MMQGKITLLIILNFYHPNIKSYRLTMLKFHQETKENRKTKTSSYCLKRKIEKLFFGLPGLGKVWIRKHKVWLNALFIKQFKQFIYKLCNNAVNA